MTRHGYVFFLECCRRNSNFVTWEITSEARKWMDVEEASGGIEMEKLKI